MLWDILYLVIGLIVGGVVGFLIARTYMKKYLTEAQWIWCNSAPPRMMNMENLLIIFLSIWLRIRRNKER